MKHLKYMFLIFITSPLIGCPNCLGRITENSPPFFSDEFYKPGAESMDDLYQALKDVPADTTVTTTSPQANREVE